MNELFHYGDSPLNLDRSLAYEQPEPHAFGKPNGLWVSAAGEDDWPAWCRDNEFGIDRLSYSSRIVLAPSANVLTITTPSELDAFTEAYAVQTDWERQRWPRGSDAREWPIDWRVVAKECDGIIVAPYQWSRRMDTNWYYGWDCASGCLWNLDAVGSACTVC